MTYQENLKKTQEWGEPQPPWEDWIIKRYASDGSIKEATLSGQGEAQRVMQLFRDLGLEGPFELVCRPRAEEVVVTSYRNEPEEEPVIHPDYIYTDRDGDEWEHIDGRWISGDTHAERVATREASLGLETLPETFGPYQRDRLVPETTEQDDEPEFYPVKPDIFAATYEEVSNE